MRTAWSAPGREAKAAPSARKKKMTNKKDVNNSEGEKTQRLRRKVSGGEKDKSGSFKDLDGIILAKGSGFPPYNLFRRWLRRLTFDPPFRNITPHS
jgi:hypothetical protein